jgi:SAM-dependent methyltransferase
LSFDVIVLGVSLDFSIATHSVQSVQSKKWNHGIRCPRCFSPIRDRGDQPRCSSADCEYYKVGFPVINAQPVLIDFPASVFDREMYLSKNGSALPRDVTRRSLGSRLHRFAFGKNPVAATNCAKFLNLLKENSERPIILVIGGGAIGLGADQLYDDPSIELIGTDVYASQYTVLVADGHRLPFDDGIFDGVWVQAVLEHVLEPATVVAEIHRVLQPKGLVYAETPFMQQVHERAYDFSRFTQSGHRWLFRQFAEISAGPVSGPGVALIWSIRYFFRALGAGDKMSRVISLPFFWIRYLDRFARGRAVADAASGFFFLGQRTDQAINPYSMLRYYDQQG